MGNGLGNEGKEEEARQGGRKGVERDMTPITGHLLLDYFVFDIIFNRHFFPSFYEVK